MKRKGITRRGTLWVGVAGLLGLTLDRRSLSTARADQRLKPVLSVHLVHRSRSDFTTPPAVTPDGFMIVASGIDGEGGFLVEIEPVLTDKDFADFGTDFDQHTSKPVVTFRLKPAPAKLFARVTRDHIGRAMAIIIDGKVVSAPHIVTEITGGKGVINGNFSLEAAKDLVARMTGKAAD